MAKLTIPDGEEPLAYANERFGAAELREARSSLTSAVYEFSTSLTVRERECARARIAGIHECAFCLRYRPARDRPGWSDDPDVVPEAHYDHIDQFRTWSGYTARERVAIEFAERYVVRENEVDDGFWERVQASFTDDEVMDLAICCATWFAFGRLNRMLEIDGEACPLHPTCDRPETANWTQRGGLRHGRERVGHADDAR